MIPPSSPLRRPLASLLTLAALVASLATAPAPRAGGADSRADRDRARAEARIERLGVFFEALQVDPARQVPAEILREARGLVILRETRAGLILGGREGDGLAFVRGTHGWGSPAFVKAREGGIGLQAGWQSATVVQVLMTDAAVAALRTNRFRFGVGLRVTSGPRTLGDEAKTKSSGSDILIYTDSGGLYGGLAVEGGSLSPVERANREYHGLEFDDVLFGRRPAPTGAARRLVELIERYSREGPRPGG